MHDESAAWLEHENRKLESQLASAIEPDDDEWFAALEYFRNKEPRDG